MGSFQALVWHRMLRTRRPVQSSGIPTNPCDSSHRALPLVLALQWRWPARWLPAAPDAILRLPRHRRSRLSTQSRRHCADRDWSAGCRRCDQRTCGRGCRASCSSVCTRGLRGPAGRCCSRSIRSLTTALDAALASLARRKPPPSTPPSCETHPRPAAQWLVSLPM